MSTQQADTVLDRATVERLSEAFRRCFETLEAGDEVLAPDVFFDDYPPFWRFQIQGREAVLDQLRSISQGPSRVTALRTVPTATGFVTEHEETMEGPEVLTVRHLWLCEVRDGRITEAVGYCNGPWDEELRARHAAEAPMLRP
jgi:ketosteroid isomerase-like protein